MQRILGLDYGEKRIGLALSDPMQLIATPHKTILNNNIVLEEILRIIESENVALVIVGLPIGMKGQETASTKKVLDFVNILKENNIDVILEDERLSSISAKKALIQQGIKTGHNKGLIDQTAAAIILQQFLDKSN